MQRNQVNKLGTNPRIKPGCGNTLGGKGSQDQAKEPAITPLLLLGIPQNSELNNYRMNAEDLAQIHADSVVSASVFVK